MAVITLLTGASVFGVMERYVKEQLNKSLQVSLQSRVSLVETEIETGPSRTAFISTNPLLIDLLQRVNADADDTAAQSRLNMSTQSFIENGLSAIALYGEDGRELARVGVFTQHPELTVPLNNLPGSAQLIWDEQLLLRAVVEIKKDGRVVGKVMTESSLPTIMGTIKDASVLGETGELALCARFDLSMQCLPTTLSPTSLIIPLRTPDGTLLPMAHALEGRTGFIITKDYRNQKVTAAYAPVGDLGLGMVLKMDKAELHAPVWSQLRYLIPLLVGIPILGLLLLRWRLTPLVARLTNEVAERKRAEDKISKLAFYDDLTGLPNRRMFYDKLSDEMKRSDRSGLPMVLMLLDIDHFKGVNDTIGHTQGDMLLVEAARRITACVRETDTVARLGGDEFTIILSEMKDVTKAKPIAQSIIKSLAVPFQLSEEIAFVSGSLGVVLYPNDAQNADDLIASADQAMYVAKDAGRNSFRYFTAALQEAAHARQSLINDLRDALPCKQLAVHYQPIVELASGKIYKAEALLRWRHPERGLVSPRDFIPVAEETGLIHEIFDWVFLEAIRELAHWRELFVPEFQISVNVSPVQLRESQGDGRGSVEGFKRNWLNQLDRLGLPRESVVLEITEGVLLNEKASVTSKLVAIHDAGIQVALDDFGTGYSTLSYLKKFNIDYLKIDQSFVKNLENNSNDRALCEAIIVMAHKLGLKVIAEGVETEPQRDLLIGFGCDYAQGWLYSKALPADVFEVLLKEPGYPIVNKFATEPR